MLPMICHRRRFESGATGVRRHSAVLFASNLPDFIAGIFWNSRVLSSRALIDNRSESFVLNQKPFKRDTNEID